MATESSLSPPSGVCRNGSATLIARLIECGTPAALVAEVAVLAARGESAELQLASRRANDAARKARQRVPVPSRPALSRGVPGQKEVPPDPPKKNHTPLPATLASPVAGGAKAMRLPDDFRMPEAWLDWAEERCGWTRSDTGDEAESFCNYWQARGDAGARRRCWRKTWENWVRNSRRPKGEVRPAGHAAAPAFASDGEWNAFCDRQAASARSIGRERQAVEWEQRKRPAAGGRA